jgi:hypothetical protein
MAELRAEEIQAEQRQRLAGGADQPIASGDQRCCAPASAVAASGLATQKTVPMKATAATLESGIMAGVPRQCTRRRALI